MKDLLNRVEDQGFDATLRIANQNAAGHERFMFPSKTAGNSPYFVVDLIAAGLSAFSGAQMKAHTATIFVSDNSLQAQAIIADCNLPADAPSRVVDLATGKIADSMYGAMNFIPIGRHELTFTPKATAASPSPAPMKTFVTTYPQFVFAGEDFGAVLNRIMERIAKPDSGYKAAPLEDNIAGQVEANLGNV